MTKPSASAVLWSIRENLGSPLWNIDDVMRLAKEAGHDPHQFCIDIGGSSVVALQRFFEAIDEQMLIITKEALWNDLKTTAKVRHLLVARYDVFTKNHELMQQIFDFLQKPHNWGLVMKIIAKTVSTVWYACGDTSTDYNFYTKRGLLALVHGNTLRTWMKDPHNREAWMQTMDDSLARVLKIASVKSDILNGLHPASQAAKGFVKSVVGRFKA